MIAVTMRIPENVHNELKKAVRRNTNNWRRMHGLPMRRLRKKTKNKRNIFVPELGRDELWQLCSLNLDAFQKVMKRKRKYGG